MTIDHTHLFTGTLNTVDSVIGTFVNTAYTHFVSANAGVITLLFTFCVMLIGYQFLYGTHFHMKSLIRHLVVMLCVYGLLMNWDLYNVFIYNIFTNEPNDLAQVLLAATHANTNILNALDTFFDMITNASLGLFSQIGFNANGLAFFFYGLIVWIAGVLMCVMALLLFIYAKMMMAIILALGPIFILFLLWDATRGIFAAWLRQLITLAFIPIITTAVLALMLSVINITLPVINQPVQNMQFQGLAPFLALSYTTSLILLQVTKISAALGGGITLANLSASMNTATRGVLEAAGLITMAGKVMQRVKKHTRSYNKNDEG